ncbi:KAP P-loop protein [Hydrocarboniclastica marina]|uniref:KAP P-loop protein n=2 Tax=Hydrocarboniclastica marina TaxID=2259620 RepID=A0A4P7XHH9_9ALTE|nr:KAP P-loop protein [Hydrocarboniclastica marina]
MAATKPVMSMPELLVFTKLFVIGFVLAEVWRAAVYLGGNFAATLSAADPWVLSVGLLVGVLICLSYAFKREAHVATARMVVSLRFDLLVALFIGIWVNVLVSPLLVSVHSALGNADPNWAPAILLMLSAILLSSLVRQCWPKLKKTAPQLYFIADEEIDDEKEDLFESISQARSFAETVLASGAHPGLIFGVEGPWGVGKTSFINLAEQHWAKAEDRVIVCRFEPLRYTSEPDLTGRLIRDLSAAIQRRVFAPEFRPAASRYSRLIKGKADFSFFGFRLSLEPSQETVDALLDDIDEVLRRIDRRVIIVIDDLDRLDAKTVNNVLFATRQTFKLSRATYILCYDTEVLAESQEESSRAREFLEKFVTVKLSLFVDSSSIRDFLRRDWQRSENKLGLIPSDTMLKLGAVLCELADILNGDLAASYLPVVGDMRKVKRFVNAMLLMQIEKSDLGRTDFNRRDLINLMLLHLHFPGLFRRIYAEETEGRCGDFSVRREYGESEFKNSVGFSKWVEMYPGTAGFLLSQLFDVTDLELSHASGVEEEVLASRACFNQDSFRNLEAYLKLIVRFATPEPQATFVLYQKAVDQVRGGVPVVSILTSPDFQLARGEAPHDQFWRVLVNRSHDFTNAPAEDSINALIEYLPRYSSIALSDRGLRQRSIYSLLRLLDRSGWGRTSGRRLPNTNENTVEIAWRIFGEKPHNGKGILHRLTSSDRGILGWNDLMLFRLQCSADRQGQLHNLQSALIAHADRRAPTSGLVSTLATLGMRKLSQEVFALFKRTYIDPQRNFHAEASAIPAETLFGEAPSAPGHEENGVSAEGEEVATSLNERVSSARNTIRSFIIYQLSNPSPPKGSGVGCGYYDEYGDGDDKGIAAAMNRYVFGVCFNPGCKEDNIFYFLDHCLTNLTSPLVSGNFEGGYVATKSALPAGLDPLEMGRYWRQHGELIRQRVNGRKDNYVFTTSYKASYSDDLPQIFDVLDELAEDAVAVDAKPDE